MTLKPLVDVAQGHLAEVAELEQVGAFVLHKVADGDEFGATQHVEGADGEVLVFQLGIEDGGTFEELRTEDLQVFDDGLDAFLVAEHKRDRRYFLTYFGILRVLEVERLLQLVELDDLRINAVAGLTMTEADADIVQSKEDSDVFFLVRIERICGEWFW